MRRPFRAAVFRQRTTENVVIYVGLQWFNRILGVVTKVILVRLLFPSDFAVFAIATGLIGFIGTFGNFGLDYAIIQKGADADEDDYNVGMTMRIVIAVALFGASFLIANPWAGLFPKFDAVTVTVTTQVLAILYLVTPWSFVPQTHLTQELRYRSIAIPNLAAQLSNAVLSIGLAFLGFGVWSLIYGLLVSQVIAVAGYIVLRGGRFRLMFRRAVARPLVSYARHLVSASLLTFLITNIDNFAVGRILGPDPLGYYAVAYGFGYLPVSLLSSPAGSALFPSLTRIQKDIGALREAYLESFSYAVVLIVPAAIGISILSPEIVHILLGPTWIPATLPLLILGFYGLGRGLVDFSSSLFAAVGTPKVIALQNLYILILSLILIYPLTAGVPPYIPPGINGTSVAMTVPVLIVAVLSLRQSARTLHGRLADFADRLWGPLLAAETMGVLVFGLRMLMYTLLPARILVPLLDVSVSESTIVLLAGILFGLAMYFAILKYVDPKVYEGVKHHIGLAIGGLPYLSQ